MGKRTIQDRLADAMLKQGLVEGPVTTRKGWRKFGPTKSGKFYFLGPSGALRVGEKISDTVSLQNMPVYKRLLGSVPA